MSLGRSNEHEEIQKRISDGVYEVVKLVGRRSDVWETFSIVLDSESKAHVGYVQCDICKAVLKFRAGSGTTHLKRHSSHSCKDHSSILNRSTSFQPTTAALIDDVTQKCVMMCGKDLLPISIVEREGFRELAQELIDIGATYGQISVSEVLPDHNAIACTVADFASRLRNNIISQAVSAAEDNACAMAVVLWQDINRRLNYMSVSVHYINKDWQVINHLLTTCTFSEIRELDEEFEEHLNAFGISKKIMQRVRFVSSEEDKVKKALGSFQRLPCAAHSITTVLNHIFDEDYLENALLSSINSVEIVVEYLKRTGYASKLEKNINQYSEDFWHRKYVMLVFVHEQINEIRLLLAENEAEDKLAGYDDGIVPELISFLGVFKEAMDQLEGIDNENEPTLQLVLLWSHKLKKHCEPSEHDNEVLKCVKKRAGVYLDLKVVLDPMHIVATFLWPSFRHLLALSDVERENTYENVRKMCSIIFIPGGTSEGTSDENTTPPKRRRLFDGWHFKEEPVGPQSEVSMYLALNDIGNDDNLMEWWQERESLLPRLSMLARQVLCIPATCAAGRVDFAAAGHIGASTSPQQTDDLMLVHDNIQLVKEIPSLKSHEFTSS